MIKLSKTLTYGAAALAAGVLLLAAPRAAHAIAATLVQVVNTTANPVPNLDAERIARIPYESTQPPQTNCPSANNIQSCSFTFTPPPTGYRLVVENVSGYLILNSSATLPPFAMLEDVDNAAGRTTVWSYAATLAQSSGSGFFASFNQPAHAVFDAGDTAPIIFVNANWESGTVQYMTLTGYLENCAITGCLSKVH